MTVRREDRAAGEDAAVSCAVTLWRVEFSPRPVDRASHSAVCRVHDWTCIWCSMDPPICGSCRPVTPPCPANGGVHDCACHARGHAGPQS